MDMIITEQPLFSIVIVTYNSSKYVLETLESAKAQTYKNIELIVSDDYSTDNTVEICINWMKLNCGSFVRTEMITVNENTGISPNINRGFLASRGEWVKGIAGDDILNPDCIYTFLEFIKLHPEVSFFFSDIDIFGSGECSPKRDSVRNWMDKSLDLFASLSTPYAQYKQIKIRNIVCSPSAIYRREAFYLLGGFDEEIKLLEDYPFWLKATKSGYKIMSIKEKLIRYRVNEFSVQTSSSYRIAFELFLQKYIFKNIFFAILIKSINQLDVGPKDKFLCNILRITSFPQRIIWKTMKKLQK